ncbi:MAG TPA: hypothetical protein DCP78_15275 [Sphingobacterium sp.]|nr:hypothetical protein [Sphingobacterium sp.]
MENENQKVKRLAPTAQTLRQLYTHSGNQCAFPSCTHPMFNSEGNFVGKVCHIEAALPGGERFNAQQTEEDRRHYDNLMLMCENHHIETNKVEIYTVKILQSYKAQHEFHFKDIDGMVRALESSVVDYSRKSTFNPPKSLNYYNKIIFPKNERTPEEITCECKAFHDYLSLVYSLSLDARKIYQMIMDYSVSQYYYRRDDYLIDYKEIARKSFLPQGEVFNICEEIERSRLLARSEDEYGREQFKLYSPSDWACAINFKKFCHATEKKPSDIISGGDFSYLDYEHPGLHQ